MMRDSELVEQSIIETDKIEKYFHSLTVQIGTIPPRFECGLSICMEVFTLAEGLGISPSSLHALWRHSVRTGYLAGLISIHEQGDRYFVWQAFVGGLLHDIGMLVFLTQQPEVFMAIVDLAQSRGQDLRTIEKSFLGTTHAESGKAFLTRWGVPQELLDIVTFHDQPFQTPYSGFSPLTAVYIANQLDGGGMAQDGDGVVDCEGEAYLLHLGLWDDLPKWQKWMRDLPLFSA